MQKLQIIKKHHYDFISCENGTRQAESDTKKELSFRSVPTRPGKGNSKVIAKKCKELRNIIMISFQAKTGQDKLRDTKKRSYHSDPFQTDLE